MTGELGLQVDGLVVRDGERTLVDGLRFVVEHAGWAVLTGEDGGDVSTVLAALAGRWPVAAGTVAFDGQALATIRSAHQIGYVRADRNLIGTLTAVENLAVVLLEAGHRSPASAWARAERQLTEVGLAPSTWHNLAEQLSGGQQQRVALARALVGRPRLLVLDNPTSELDPDSAALVVSVLDRARARGTCCVLASSDETLLEACPSRVGL